MRVLTPHIGELLTNFYAAGHVHRSITPEIIMRLPRTMRWSLINIGCAARTGSHAGTPLSLSYAVPGMMQTFNAQHPGLLVTEVRVCCGFWPSNFSMEPVFRSLAAERRSVCTHTSLSMSCLSTSCKFLLPAGHILVLELPTHQSKCTCGRLPHS